MIIMIFYVWINNVAILVSIYVKQCYFWRSDWLFFLNETNQFPIIYQGEAIGFELQFQSFPFLQKDIGERQKLFFSCKYLLITAQIDFVGTTSSSESKYDELSRFRKTGRKIHPKKETISNAQFRNMAAKDFKLHTQSFLRSKRIVLTDYLKNN